MFQRVELVTPPASEPVTLDEAKDFLRLTIDDDDTEVTGLIIAARMYCETLVKRSFIATTWDVFLDCWPNGGGGGYLDRHIRQHGESYPAWLPTAGAGIVDLPKSPLMSVTTVKYYDTTGTLTTIDPSLFNVSLGTPGRIEPVFGHTWPIPQPRIDAVQIRVVSGYGNDATSVPETIKVAVRLAVTALYENRGDANAPMPDAISKILGVDMAGVYN